jgi:serine/threonine protein kinase HipA of HipAB toxin-antitoxin module
MRIMNLYTLSRILIAYTRVRIKRVLAIERFDRIWTRDHRLLRMPQEGCCRALSIPPSRKHESEGGPGVRDLTELLKGSDPPDEDQKTVFKAQIVFWLLGATDGHAKNFSIWLAPGGRFRLAPLYDIVSTQPSVDAGQLSHNQMKTADRQTKWRQPRSRSSGPQAAAPLRWRGQNCRRISRRASPIPLPRPRNAAWRR